MKKVQSRAAALALPFLPFLFLLFPALSVAQGFGIQPYEAIDQLPWPSLGEFPAYPRTDVRPTQAWVHAGMRYDNNVLRRETNTVSDTVSRVGGGFRHDQRVLGRQRLLVEGRGDWFNYHNFSSLDHFAYSMLGDYRYELGNDLSGSVILARDRRQTQISETGSTRSDIAVQTRLGASGAYVVSPYFRLHGGVGVTRADREARPDANTRGYAWNGGGAYVSPLGNTLGVEYRVAHGSAPVSEFVAPLGTFVNNDYHERELALIATYSPGPQLRLGGRIGRTKRGYTQIADRDFDGITGRLLVDWLPGNKTHLGFEMYKVPQSIIDVSASHVLTTGLAFGPRWAPTAKTVVSARLMHERRRFQGDPAFTVPGAVLRDELVDLLRLAVGWEPERHYQVGLAVDRGTRQSNTLDRDYKFWALMGNIAWTW
jgi:hypothetical protein